MKIQSMFTAALCAAALSPVAANAAAVQPDVGYYRALIYVTAANGAGCADIGYAVGSQSSGIFYYTGPLTTGTVMRFPNSTDNAILLQAFPKTPAAGVATWSGTSKEGYEGSGQSEAIPFKATITYLDKASFSAVFSATIALSATSACKITENIVFFKTGS